MFDVCVCGLGAAVLSAEESCPSFAVVGGGNRYGMDHYRRLWRLLELGRELFW
ncbi:MAG: hypothetical protein CM1200mP41_27500 [Gammaproteobacteria bacterium]|nr:MAG: hypothetical protein CM1200mP41_27500 [Gammaproteobacteria bacterium]